MKKKLVSLIVAASVASAFAPVMAEPKSQDVTVTTSSPDNAYLYSAVLRPGARMKYRFINDHRHEFKVATMCRVLELTRGGFYQWIQKPLSVAGKAGEGSTRHRSGLDQRRASSTWAATATQASDEPDSCTGRTRTGRSGTS